MNCLKNKKLEFRFAFVPYGSFLDAESGTLAVDVGNRLCKGVIDHHQPGAESECAASLVFKHPEFITDHLKNLRLDEITIITHELPDFDAVTSAFLSYKLLKNGIFPEYTEIIIDYTRDIDRGVCFKKPGIIATPYGIFSGISSIIQQTGKNKNWDKNRIDLARMECGFSMWEYILSKFGSSTDLHDSDIFKSNHPFRQAQDLIEKDYHQYLKDLAKYEPVKIKLPLKNNHNKKEVDGLVITNPQSLLFKSWARNDLIHSPKGQGFIFLAVNYHDTRYVISVEPESPVYLKGLGEMLEDAESQKRERLSLPRKGRNRPGYNSPDPWYDGRNPLHNYTIIDTPREGTVLSWEEIKNIIFEYSK